MLTQPLKIFTSPFGPYAAPTELIIPYTTPCFASNPKILDAQFMIRDTNFVPSKIEGIALITLIISPPLSVSPRA